MTAAELLDRIIPPWRTMMISRGVNAEKFDSFVTRKRSSLEHQVGQLLIAFELQRAQQARAQRLEEAQEREEEARADLQRTITKAAGRSDFQERKEARIDHLRERAVTKAQESQEAYERSRKRLERIPFGQPILVGHHSEGRHWRDIRRADADMRKSIEARNEAVRAERRAEAAEEGRAISSDDPDAIFKLEKRLAEREAERKRLHERKRSGEEIEGWRFSNLSADIRRIKLRVDDLKKRAAETVPPDYVVGEYRATWDSDDNRVAVYMPFVSKGDARTHRAEVMRRAGFVWSPSNERYQRKASNGAWYQAKSAIDTLAPDRPASPERVSSISPIKAPVTPSAAGLTAAELDFLEELNGLDKTPNSGVARWHSIDPDTTTLNPPASVRHLEELGYILYRKDPEAVALTMSGSLLAFNAKRERGSEVRSFEVVRVLDYWVVGVLKHAVLLRDVENDDLFVADQTSSLYTTGSHHISSVYNRDGYLRHGEGLLPITPGSRVELRLGPPSTQPSELPPQAAELFASSVARYDDALKRFREALARFRRVESDYRAQHIGDEKYLAARAEYDLAQKALDRAEAEADAEDRP